MAYPFVSAKYFTPRSTNGILLIRALVIHMTEGADGGAVSWLHNGPYTVRNGVRIPQDNSSDYVMHPDGSITQMVKDQDYSHSLHWDAVHQSSPTCGYFSLKSATGLLGISTGVNPLPFIKSVELVGFAAKGPTAAQITSLKNDLIPHVRKTFPKMRGLLGHRDFMGYKACPGCHVFDKVHHGAWVIPAPTPAPTPVPVPPPGGEPMIAVSNNTPKLIDIKIGTVITDLNGARLADVAVQAWRLSPFEVGGTKRAVITNAGGGDKLGLVPLTAIAGTKDVPSGTDCTAVVKAAVDPLNAKLAAIQAWLAAVPK